MKQVPFILGICHLVVRSCSEQHEQHLTQLKRHHLIVLVVKGISALPLKDVPQLCPSGALMGAQKGQFKATVWSVYEGTNTNS